MDETRSLKMGFKIDRTCHNRYQTRHYSVVQLFFWRSAMAQNASVCYSKSTKTRSETRTMITIITTMSNNIIKNLTMFYIIELCAIFDDFGGDVEQGMR